MDIIVQGVKITLTKSQVQTIESVEKRRLKCKNSFKKMLTHFGFKENADQPNTFSHKAKQWYAEIIDRGVYSDVWMVGRGLKSSSGMPGGWVYESPKEIETEIIKAMDKS